MTEQLEKIETQPSEVPKKRGVEVLKKVVFSSLALSSILLPLRHITSELSKPLDSNQMIEQAGMLPTAELSSQDKLTQLKQKSLSQRDLSGISQGCAFNPINIGQEQKLNIGIGHCNLEYVDQNKSEGGTGFSADSPVVRNPDGSVTEIDFSKNAEQVKIGQWVSVALTKSNTVLYGQVTRNDKDGLIIIESTQKAKDGDSGSGARDENGNMFGVLQSFGNTSEEGITKIAIIYQKVNPKNTTVALDGVWN